MIDKYKYVSVLVYKMQVSCISEQDLLFFQFVILSNGLDVSNISSSVSSSMSLFTAMLLLPDMTLHRTTLNMGKGRKMLSLCFCYSHHSFQKYDPLFIWRKI